jgi:hypothetical protein
MNNNKLIRVWCSQSDYARAKGLSRQRVYQLVKDKRSGIETRVNDFGKVQIRDKRPRTISKKNSEPSGAK